MQLTLLCITIVTICTSGGHALPFPSFAKTCSRNDPNLDECALKSGREAIPFILKGDKKYHIPSMLPLIIDRIEIKDELAKSQSVGLQVTLTNVRIFNLDTFDVKNIKIDLEEKKASLRAFGPNLVLLCDYEVDGHVLVLPIKGHGPGNITLGGMDFTYFFGWDLKLGDDGKEHMVVKDSRLEYSMQRVYINLENLFDGNKVLGDNMNQFMNENWQEVLKDIGPAIGESFSAVITQILNGISGLVPYAEIFPDTP